MSLDMSLLRSEIYGCDKAINMLLLRSEAHVRYQLDCFGDHRQESFDNRGGAERNCRGEISVGPGRDRGAQRSETN